MSTTPRLRVKASTNKPGLLEVRVTNGPAYHLLEMSIQEMADFMVTVPSATRQAIELSAASQGNPLDLSMFDSLAPTGKGA